MQYGFFNFLETDRQFKSWMQGRVHSPSSTYIHGHRFKSLFFIVFHSTTFSAIQCSSGSFTHKKWLESLMQRSTFTFIDRQTLMSERDEVLKAWCNWRILSPLMLQLGQLSLRLLFVQQHMHQPWSLKSNSYWHCCDKELNHKQSSAGEYANKYIYVLYSGTINKYNWPHCTK